MPQKKIDSFLDKFIVGDCVDEMKKIPSTSIDLVLTSPPYADQRDYGHASSLISPDSYVTWFAPKAEQIYRILKDNGSFVLNINDKVINKYQHLYVFELVIFLCKSVGFHLVRDYIWYNPATPPNVFSRGGYGRTKKSHEHCFWFVKGDNWTFNLDPVRRPYSKDMQKYLKGEGKGQRSENTRPSTHNFNCEKVWNDKGGADPGSVLVISNTSSNDALMRLCKENGFSHPARFPLGLADFFILSGTNKNDIVLDPFSGSGTTAVSAAKNNRRWIGIDANAEYCELAQARIKLELEGDAPND